MVEGKIEGVFFEMKVLTGNLNEKIRYWAREEEDGTIVLEYLTLKDTSTGMEAERISREDFGKRFQVDEEEKEPEKTPKEMKVHKLVRQGEIHLEKEEFHSAQYEFGNAIKVDKKNVKANFGLGKSYIGTGDTEKAKEVFANLGQNEELYKKENKHTFNEMGILLRKQEFYEQALMHYRRAIEIDPKDPVLFFNLGRAFFHSGDKVESIRSLEQAISLKPDFTHAQDFMEHVRRSI
ncbi:MAG: tetratricopeptide repeat protein [bacterium]